MKMIRHLIAALLAAALLCGALTALAADTGAADLTKKCRFTTSVNPKKLSYMHNGKHNNHWDGETDGEVTVTCPRQQKAQGIMLTFFRDVVPVQIVDADGGVLAEYSDPYATEWIPFSRPSAEFTIRRANPDDPLRISDIHVMGAGDLPDWVQRWETLEGDADMLLVATHPDDEILWFGGMIPTYAGQRQYKVIVLYMVGGSNGMRIAELLDGLWVMGVRLYPDIGSLPDVSGTSMASAYMNWGGEDTAPARITEAIRRYRPRVVVTQDIHGEYGHYHHVVTAQATIDAVSKYAADPDYDPASAEKWGVWQPQKLYLHLWREDQTKFDWRQPLSAFGGRTGMQVAAQAYKKHVSQQSSRYRLHDKGRLDNSLFGLCFSTVGPDERHDDLFEHVTDLAGHET